jgi:hypothetical protein
MQRLARHVDLERHVDVGKECKGLRGMQRLERNREDKRTAVALVECMVGSVRDVMYSNV